jgi:hypothetical protein
MTRFSVLAASLAVLSSAAWAQDVPIKGVVELFTSQSCSSCPPADKVLGEVIKRGDVIALAFHVDYWNYLDWKDTFSDASFTKRQYDYAASFGSSQVYTPQMIVNGKQSVKAGSPDSVFAAIDEMKKNADPLSVAVSASIDKGHLNISAGKGSGDANLVLVIFEAKETVDILRGENSGKSVEYRNAVTEVRTIGMWKGGDLKVELPAKEYMEKKGYGCAVLLQRQTANGTPGEIIGAALISGLEG